MNIEGKHYTTIWLDEHDPETVKIIDQRSLPFRLVFEDLRTVEEACAAIRDMHVRGAPLIGVAGAFGMYLALLRSPRGREAAALEEAAAALVATRPTAVNLAFAVNKVRSALDRRAAREELIAAALAEAQRLRRDEIDFCRRIGEHGVALIEGIASRKPGETVNVLTHCNAGWLACVDYGTATSPIYLAHDRGVPVHVWVDETRPRNQGARLTAYELGEHGVPHTVIVDNAGGHLMQHGRVDMVIVGSDRTTAAGDVCNKIGTYLKALAAGDNGVPFYAALPSSTIDFSIRDGVKEIEVEERNQDEVKFSEGFHGGAIVSTRVTPERSRAANPGFDVTPARLVTGIITERGIAEASEAGLRKLFPEKSKPAR